MVLVDPLLKYSWFPESSSLYLQHAHEIVLALVFYQILSSLVAPAANRWIFGDNYTKLTSNKIKIDFDIHSVSMVQCILSLLLIIPIVTLPLNLPVSSYQDDYSSMVTAFSMGYFIWDLIICIRYFKLYGIQFLIHGMISLYVFSLTLRPFCQPWIGKFLLFEASTPFVNINWYIIQLSKHSPSSKSVVPMWFNVLNGILLLIVFFAVRIVWGFSAIAILVYRMWQERAELPLFEGVSSIGLNLVMDVLNVIWFMKMIRIAKKMATAEKKHND